SFNLAGRRGQPRREKMIMTRDKAVKTIIRQRMAATGEPYSVARHAVTDSPDIPDAEPAGIWAVEIEARTSADRARERAERLQMRADQIRRAAEQAQEQADQAQEQADRIQRAADRAER